MKSRFTLPLLVTTFFTLGMSSWGQTTSSPSGSWLLRVRSLQVESAVRSDSFTNNNLVFAKDAVRLSSKSALEVALSRSLGGNLSLEVGQTTSQKRQVFAVGTGSLGTADQAVTTAILQYHAKTTTTGLKGYVGVGIGSSRFTNSKLALFNSPVTFADSTGLVLQVGVDYKLSNSLYLNLDFKRLSSSSDLKSNTGAKLTTVSTDPNLFGGGIAYRF